MTSQTGHLAQSSQEQATEEAQYYRRILRRLVGIGAELAEDILQQASAPHSPGALKPDLTARFERVTRSNSPLDRAHAQNRRAHLRSTRPHRRS